MELIEAKVLTELYIEQYNLIGWRASFDNALRRLGCCFYSDKIISLSRYFVELNHEERVERTIKHEIAHAIAGPNEGHGYKWKQICKELGIQDEAIRATSKDNVTATPMMKYIRYCPNCGYSYPAQRLSKTKYACKECCEKHNFGRYDERFILKYKLNSN